MSDPRHWPDADLIRRNFARFAALGLAVEITEMDVPVGEMKGDGAQRLEQQKRLTHDIVAACALAVSACSGVTFWGFTDRYSWLNSRQWGWLRGRGSRPSAAVRRWQRVRRQADGGRHRRRARRELMPSLSARLPLTG